MTASTELRPSVRAAFAGLIDYAGLFPPARLSLDAARREYDELRATANLVGLSAEEPVDSVRIQCVESQVETRARRIGPSAREQGQLVLALLQATIHDSDATEGNVCASTLCR